MDTRRRNSYYHVVRYGPRVNDQRNRNEPKHSAPTRVPDRTGIRPVPIGKFSSRRILRHILTMVTKHHRSLCTAFACAVLSVTATAANATPTGSCTPTNSEYLMNDLCSIAGPAAEWSILGGSLLIGSWYVWNMARRAAR